MFLLTAEAEVQIRITDQNDNAPSFRYRVYKAAIPENVDVGTRIIHVTAQDKDEGRGRFCVPVLYQTWELFP